MEENQHKIKNALSRTPIWLVFVITIGIGVASSYCLEGPNQTYLIAHAILGPLYAAGGILFLYMCKSKRWWNVFPAAVGILTATFSLSLIYSYLCNSGDIFIGLNGAIMFTAGIPCIILYCPLMVYVMLTLGSHPLQGCIIMTILGILLTFYCIRNIVKNKPAPSVEVDETQLT